MTGDPDPTADDPHAVLGVPPDADSEQIRLAASVAKQRYNPDRYPDGEKRRAREQFYEVVAAEETLLGGEDESADEPDHAASDQEEADAGLDSPARPRVTLDADDGPWEPRVPVDESVGVRVTDADDGRPLAGVSVVARSLSADGGRAGAKTDSDGRVRLDLSPGRWVVRVDATTADAETSDPVAVRVARPTPRVASGDGVAGGGTGEDTDAVAAWLARGGTLATVGGIAAATLAVALGWPSAVAVAGVAVAAVGVAGLRRAAG